jgi:PadR family transcriptional regulator, regulatory protein PadR
VTLARETGQLLQGTLGLLILKALLTEDRHGYGVGRWVHEMSGSDLEIEEGSLYPALRRLEDRGFVTSRWAVTEHNRRARFYSLTPEGRRHLEQDARSWMHFSSAVTRILRAEPGVV